MNKKEISVIGLAIVISFIFLFVLIYNFNPGITGFAIYSQSGDDFNSGSYDSTELSSSLVSLTSGSSSGSYTSSVYDAGSAVSWNNISWVTSGVFGIDLPDNQGSDSVDMSSNFLLLHLDSDYTDSSGNSNDGSGVGSLSFSDGVYNNALVVDGSDEYASIPNSGLDFSDSYSVEFWINPSSSAGQWKAMVEKSGSFTIDLISNDKVRVQGSGYATLDSSVGLTRNEWSHVVFTLSNTPTGGDVLKLYINGQERGSVGPTWGTPGSSTNDLRIGGAGASDYVDGMYDEFAAYSRVLSADEVLDRYNRGIASLDAFVRSCDDSECSGESWVDIDDVSSQDLSVDDNQYFQYKFDFTGSDSNPELESVDIDYSVLNSAPTIEIVNPVQGNSYSSSDVALDYNVLDEDDNIESCWYVLNSGSETIIPGCENISISAIGGNNNLEVYVNDTNGEQASDSVSFNVQTDFDVPVLSFGSSTSEGSYNTNTQDWINVSVEVSDDSDVYSFVDFNNSLIGFYNMNSSTISDSSSYSNDGTSGDVEVGSGKFGNALEFNGESSYINLGDFQDFDDIGTSNFSICSWIKLQESSSTVPMRITEQYNGASPYNGMTFHYRPSDNRLFGWTKNSADTSIQTTSYNLDNNEWHHVCFVRNSSSELVLYIDGSVGIYETGKSAGDVNTDYNNFGFGIGYSPQFGQYFNGSIDEVLVFNRALSEEEISALYSASDYSLSFSDLSAGSYSFYAYAQDAYGNEAQTDVREVEFIDNTAPSVSIVSPITSEYDYGTEIELNYNINDLEGDLSACWYNLGDENVSLVDCDNASLSGLVSANYNLVVYANDSSGLTGSDSISFDVVNSAPSVEIVSPVNQLYTESVELNYNINDLEGDLSACWYSLDSVNTTLEGCDNTTLDLEDGFYDLVLYVNDSENLVSSDSISFSVDTTGVSIEIVEPIGDKTTRNNIPINYNVQGDDLNCWYSVFRGSSVEIDNTSLVDCGNSSFNVTVDADFILRLYVNNTYGSVASDSSSFSVDTNIEEPSTPTTTTNTGSSGGGGGSSIPVSSSISLEVSDLGDVIFTKQESKTLELSVQNKLTRTYNKCRLVGKGVESDDVKNINGGEIVEFIFELSPDTDGNLSIECIEGKKLLDLNVYSIESSYLADISGIEVNEKKIVVGYIIESDFDSSGVFNFSLINQNGNVVDSKQEELTLVKGENTGIIEFNSSERGMMRVSVREGEAVLAEENFISEANSVTGRAITDIISNTNVWIGVIGLFFVVFAFFIVRRIFMHSKRNKVKGHK